MARTPARTLLKLYPLTPENSTFVMAGKAPGARAEGEGRRAIEVEGWCAGDADAAGQAKGLVRPAAHAGSCGVFAMLSITSMTVLSKSIGDVWIRIARMADHRASREAAFRSLPRWTASAAVTLQAIFMPASPQTVLSGSRLMASLALCAWSASHQWR